MNKVCVATPMYNASKYLKRLIDSFGDYEFVWIVYNDGSTDNTQEVLVELLADKPNIKLVYSESLNHGLTYGRNFLCQQFIDISNEYNLTHMVFIDSDDYFKVGWLDTINYWINKVTSMYPQDKKGQYLCFKYWNDRTTQDENAIYSKLHTHLKYHPAICQYSGGGYDLLHVIPKDYLIEVKKWDGNYYHTVKDEKWTPDTYNFMFYTDYPASFISDIVACLGKNDGNMSDTYYENVVTKYARGQVEEVIQFFYVYGKDRNKIGADWSRVPAHRWRWAVDNLVRMIENGTLVFSGKKWDRYEPSDDIVDSNHSKLPNK